MNIRQAYNKWRENYRTFRFYFRKYRRFYVFGIVSLIIVDGLEPFPPLLLKVAVGPRQKQVVPGPGLDDRRAREYEIAERVANRAQPKVIDRAAVGEQLENLSYPSLVILRVIEPADL